MFEDTRAEPQICNLANLRELSNANLLAKIGVDTAENEPCKDLQEVCKILQDLQKVCKIFTRLAKCIAKCFAFFKDPRIRFSLEKREHLRKTRGDTL